MPERTAIVLLAGLATAISASAWAAADVTVTIAVLSGPLPQHCEVVAERVAAAAQLSSGGVVVRPIKSGPGGGVVAVTLQPGVWSVRPRATGSWGESKILHVGETAQELTLRLWPSGKIAGRVVIPQAEAMPDRLRVGLSSVPGTSESSTVPTSRIDCSVEAGTWSCDVPAGALDLEIVVPWAVGQYRWGVAVPKGGTKDVGLISFRRGTSIVGMVRTAASTQPCGGCRVILRTPDGEPVLPSVVGGLAEARPLGATTNDRGFFQIIDVPAGRYALIASQAGWANASSIVDVFKDVQTAASPLVLERPRTLDVVVDPPLDPWGKQWMVEIVGDDPLTRKADTATWASKAGAWKREGLSPGHYWLTVQGGSGTRWASQEVDVPAPGVVRIDVPVVRIAGTVKYGRDPIEATVLFGGSRGAVRVPFRSDREGAFSGLLPKNQQSDEIGWQVYVEATDPPVQRTFHGVRPAFVSGSSEASVELEALIPSDVAA